jgi:hypothetical protein
MHYHAETDDENEYLVRPISFYAIVHVMLQRITTTSTSITAATANSTANDNIPSSCSVYSFSVNP